MSEREDYDDKIYHLPRQRFLWLRSPQCLLVRAGIVAAIFFIVLLLLGRPNVAGHASELCSREKWDDQAEFEAILGPAETWVLTGRSPSDEFWPERRRISGVRVAS